jgi:hypothetical protein
MKTIGLIFLILAFTIACKHKNSAEKNANKDSIISKVKSETNKLPVPSNDSILPEQILATVSKLPEIQEADKYIDSISDHRERIAYLWEKPDKENLDYVIQFGYDGKERFETYYWIYVSPITLNIRFYDVINDSLYGIEDYRKLKRLKFY